MLHHYGKVFPKIYASPIKPRKSSSNDDGGKCYLDYIRNDLEENLSEQLSRPSDPPIVAAQVPALGMYFLNVRVSFLIKINELRVVFSENPEVIQNYSPQIRFSREEDLRLLEAVKIHDVTNGLCEYSRKNWNDIKFTSKVKNLKIKW